MLDTTSKRASRLSLAGMLITIGIVYGDIGTSPLYVMNAIVTDAGKLGNVSPDYVIGSVSLVFWTLMIITTLKYVTIALKADNKGEGGIFALYALVRKHAKWLVWPALIGGAALLADGTLTPAVTVTSAIEGMKGQKFGSFTFSNSQHDVVLITIVILIALFMVQRFGTAMIGRAFGPIMLVWFSFIAIAGVFNLLGYPQMLLAISPTYAIKVLFSPENRIGIFILGSIFLATTGAEALYSDMGHVGKDNIYGTWPIIYGSLILNYLGQGAWMVLHAHDAQFANMTNINPFYEMIPQNFKLFAIIISTCAAIIASQALITGSYTLVSEAIGLKFLPRMIIKHPSNSQAQIYISTVNWILGIITVSIVLYFGSSQKMQAAYGLAITVTMLMTTVLLSEFLGDKLNKPSAYLIAGGFLVLETIFLIASLTKFIHGGYVTFVIMMAILYVMVIWYFGNKRRDAYERGNEYVSLMDYKDQLGSLTNDEREPLFADNLVYLTNIRSNYRIKRSAMYSILDQGPKKARVYWFVTVNETNAPYESTYTADMFGTDNIVSVQLYLGFRKPQTISVYLHQIVKHMVEEGLLPPQIPRYSTMKHRKVGDFKFVLINERPADLAANTEIKPFDRRLISGRIMLQNMTVTPKSWYGLEFSSVVEEASPLFISLKPDDYLVKRKIYHSKVRKDDISARRQGLF